MLEYFFGKDETEKSLDGQINAVLIKLESLGPENDEYPTMLGTLERLSKIKAERCHDQVSRDTIALIAGNLMGILLIIAYEQKHVLTSRSFSQIIKPR